MLTGLDFDESIFSQFLNLPDDDDALVSHPQSEEDGSCHQDISTTLLRLEPEQIREATPEVSVLCDLASTFLLGLGFDTLQLIRVEIYEDGRVQRVIRPDRIEEPFIFTPDIPSYIIEKALEDVAGLMSYLISYDGVTLSGPARVFV
jgi:hypothetical protein